MVYESREEIVKDVGSVDVDMILGGSDGKMKTWTNLCSQTSLSKSALSSFKGLQNRIGENNCFLNSIVQVLWHLETFRKSFLLVTGHACVEKSCIFCALKAVFTQFQFSDCSTLPPDSLRRALATAFARSKRFQLGLMDDATECFEIILQWLHFHLAFAEPSDRCTVSHCIPHVKFGMNIIEQSYCIMCGAKDRCLTFTELIHYIPTSAIMKPVNGQNKMSFGEKLKVAEEVTEPRTCPENCGGVLQRNCSLSNSPDVLTVGLIWDSDKACSDDIVQLTTSIDNVLKPSDLFQSDISSEFQLVGVVCYYRKHYSTFLFDRRESTWILFDDATVIQVGPSWSLVANKICCGRFQPLLLFYENPIVEPISLLTAPSKTFFVDFPLDYESYSQGREMNSLETNWKRQIPDYEGGNPAEAQYGTFPESLGFISSSNGNLFQSVRDHSVQISHSPLLHSSFMEEQLLDKRQRRVQEVKTQLIQMNEQSDISTFMSPLEEVFEPDSVNYVPDIVSPHEATPLNGSCHYYNSLEVNRSCHHGSCNVSTPNNSLDYCRCHGSYWTQSEENMSHRFPIQEQEKNSSSVSFSMNQTGWPSDRLLKSFICNSSKSFADFDSSYLEHKRGPTASLQHKKRTSISCSWETTRFTYDKISHAVDDQLLSLTSHRATNGFGKMPCVLGGFLPSATSESVQDCCTLFQRRDAASKPCCQSDDANIDDANESYINSEIVKTVLKSQGMKFFKQSKLAPQGSTENKEGNCSTIADHINNLSDQLKTSSLTSSDNRKICKNAENFNKQPCMTEKCNWYDKHVVVGNAGMSTNRTHVVSKAQQKGILLKHKRQKKKRVSFSDNIAMVLCAEDVLNEPVNYITYFQQMTIPQHDLRSSSLSSTSSDTSSCSSLSSDFSVVSPTLNFYGRQIENINLAEGTQHSEQVIETESDDDLYIIDDNLEGGCDPNSVRCNLCCKKWIVSSEVYCRDCAVYMLKLQHKM